MGAARFLTEIRTTAALQHPHILPLFDSGEAGGQLYYVMPYVPGETLRSRLARERQLPVEDAMTRPAWRRDGRELYYWQGDQLLAANLEPGGGADAPPVVRGRTPLFRASVIPSGGYDVSPDGTHFVVVTGGARASKLVVALDTLTAGRSHKSAGHRDAAAVK